jgi:hypothetical protein
MRGGGQAAWVSNWLRDAWKFTNGAMYVHHLAHGRVETVRATLTRNMRLRSTACT